MGMLRSVRLPCYIFRMCRNSCIIWPYPGLLPCLRCLCTSRLTSLVCCCLLSGVHLTGTCGVLLHGCSILGGTVCCRFCWDCCCDSARRHLGAMQGEAFQWLLADSRSCLVLLQGCYIFGWAAR